VATSGAGLPDEKVNGSLPQIFLVPIKFGRSINFSVGTLVFPFLWPQFWLARKMTLPTAKPKKGLTRGKN
jgi:hypothetical protein